MNRHGTRVVVATRAASAMALLGLLLSGCASRSYVALLANEDGTVGEVHVTAGGGTTHLDKEGQAAVIGAPQGTTFTLDDKKLTADFAGAIAASPKGPISFLLYFESGKATLTAQSNAVIPRILQVIHERLAADISVIGHTDTVGHAAGNDALSRERVDRIAELIRGHAKAQHLRISIESHGESNLLVPTPDNTEEARNRRVEVTVR